MSKLKIFCINKLTIISGGATKYFAASAVVLCLLIVTSVHGQIIKFQSAGGAGSVLSGNGTIKNVGSAGTIVSQGAGQNNQAGFLFGNIDYRPGVQSSSLTFSGATANQITLNFTRGNGSRRIVVVKAGSVVNEVPVNGTGYTANATFGSGTQIGSGNYVVYDGGVADANSVTVTNLNLSTTIYYVKVFEFNGKYGGNISNVIYQPNDANLNPLASPPIVASSSVSFSAVKKDELTLSWTSGNGSNRLLIAKLGNAVDAVPANGQTYTANTVFGSGAAITSNNFVVYNGAGNTATVTGLQPNTTYHFKLVEFNGSTGTANYTVSTSASKLTLTVPTIVAAATAISQTSFSASWLAVTGSTTFFIDVSTDNFSTYVPGFADKSVTGITTSITGLQPGTTYQYRVRASNASGSSENSNAVSVITVPATPTISESTLISNIAFTANWNACQSATEYFIDVATDNAFTQIVTGFNNKSININSALVTGLLGGNEYYVRVRSKNGSGTSPSSTVFNQITTPNAPVALDASNEQPTTFKANWQGVTGIVDEYELIVSKESNFTQLVATLLVNGGINEKIVTGLDFATEYFYRIRAKNASGFSAYSNIKSLITKNSDGTSAIPPLVEIGLGGTETSVVASVSGGDGALTLSIIHRPIRGSAYVTESEQSIGVGSTNVAVNKNWLDELGVEYYFRVKDSKGKTDTSSHAFVYKSIADSEKSIPGLSFGGEQKNYRIISIPYKLDQANTQLVFSALGPYDKTKWRLLNWNGTTYIDNPNLVTIGKGYWFNAREQTTIALGEGTVSQNNQTNHFSLSLQQGWNMVATPYPFTIGWSDVLAENAGANVDEEYYIYSGNGYTTTDAMEPFKGGFVYANAATTLDIPVTLGSSGGRKAASFTFNENPDEGNWLIPITLQQGEIENTLQAFGMHQDASLSKDRFDAIALPAFLDFAELTTTHEEYFSPRFMRDVVPLKESYVWSFNLTAPDNESVTLRWNNEPFKSSRSQILLYDAKAGQLIDMHVNSSYSTTGNKLIEFIFSTDEKYVINRELGKAYPNPFTQEIQLPAFLNTIAGRAVVSVTITSVTGVEVYTREWQTNAEGLIQPVWDGKDARGNTVAEGVYIYQLRFNNSKQTITSQGKLLKQ